MAYMKDVTGQRLDAIKVVAGPATRQGYVPLSAPNQSQSATSTDFTYRSLVRLPFNVLRWRIGFMNRNLRSTTVPTATPAVTGVFVGTPTYGTTSTSGARWAGNCTGALTQVSGALAVPGNGSRVWSSWIENADFDKNVEKVISWGMTTAASGTIAFGNALQVYRASGSANAGNASLSSPSVGTALAFCDIVIEYEYTEPVQSVLFVGDSNTLTYVPDAPPLLSGPGAGALPPEMWPLIAGDLGGFSAVNIGVGSTSTTEWYSTSPILFDRLDIASLNCDAAVVSLGTNELSGTGLSAVFVPGFLGVNAKLRTLGIKRIFWTTIPPRGETTFGRLAAGASTGATTISTSYNHPNGTVLIGSGTNAELVTVSGTTGSGPYTLTISALTKDHLVNEPTTSSSEMGRRLYNNFIRQMPDGIAGVIDFDRLLEASPESPDADQRYVASDKLHFQRSASLLKAQAAVAAGVAPKLI